jgi:hypothetical protein
LNTDNTRIKAAVPTPIPSIAIPVMILIAFVLFLLNKYRRAMRNGKRIGPKVTCLLSFVSYRVETDEIASTHFDVSYR